MECELEDRTYTFAELSDKAKERAREKWRATALQHDWWDTVYEDAVAMGKSLGLHIGDYDYSAQRGNEPAKMYTKPDIWFSGFCSQGDGCCWSGHVHAAELQDAMARVAKEVGTDDELVELARVAEDLFAEIAAVAAFNRLCSDDENRDWPEVETTMRLTVLGHERSYSTQVDDNFIPEDIAKTANVLVEGFASWIYRQLETEHDYQLSDEVIDEAIDCAALAFDEDGNELA